jgi:krueppel-like factor 6/7
MDILPSGGIFRELQVVHDTGYFSGQASLEEDWHQVNSLLFSYISILYSIHCWKKPNMTQDQKK